MNNPKLFISFALVSFIAQGALTTIYADLPTASSTPSTDASSLVKDMKIPTLEECVDSKEPWGLNLNNVNARQIRLRKDGKGGTPDAAKNIINLQQLLDRLQGSPVMEKENQEKVLRIKNQIKEKMQASVDKKISRKDKKKLADDIAQLNTDLQKENASMVMFKNPLFIKTQMDTLKESILSDLGKHGLTAAQLEKLPSLETWRKNPAYKPED